MPKIIAELRDWTKHEENTRDVFQGRVFNDISHVHKDGFFKTIRAHDVSWNESGCLVTASSEGDIYVLWFAHRRKIRNDNGESR